MLSERSDYKDRVKPCKAGQMRVPITTYRCINNSTFHSQLQNKLKYIKSRSLPRSPIVSNHSSRRYFTPRSRSRYSSKSPRKSSPKRVKLSFLQDIQQGRKLKTVSPTRSLLQQRKNSRHASPKKSANLFLQQIERGATKLRHVSPRKIRNKSPVKTKLFNQDLLNKLKNRRNIIETDDDNDFSFDGRRKRKRSFKKKW